VKLIGWTKVAAKSIETGMPTPAKPIFPTFELSLRAPRLSVPVLSGPELSETGAGRRRC